jgi:uncharacterized protein (DUF362 family)
VIITSAAGRFTGVPVVDLATADSIKLPAPGVWSRRDVTYRVPRALLDCDKLISIAPLKIAALRPSLSVDNFRMLGAPLANARGSETPDLTAADLYGFHPADYCVVGGGSVLRNGAKVRHNVVIAGSVPAGVDAVGASLLNVKPDAVRLLQLIGSRYVKTDLDEIWVIGNEIEEARLKPRAA